MAIDFPATSGQATDGSYTHTASGITWAWDGTTWKAQGVTASYVLPTASATVLGGIKVGTGLSINSSTSVLSANSIALGGLSDVSTSGVNSGEILKYNGSSWAPAADDSGASALTIKDEGIDKTTAASSIDFVGAGVTATNSGTDVTVTIPGGGSGAPEITWTLTAPNAPNDYTFSGDGFPTSQTDPTLYLIRGQTYKFVNNTGGHPFRIQSTVAQAGGGTVYNSGVTNQDATGGTGTNVLTFVVPMDAPDTLYYQCTAHPAMTGTIHVITQGSSGLKSRTTVSGSTGSIAANASAGMTLDVAKTYVLHKIQTDAAAWVVVYTDTTSRTNDANRTELEDPVAGAGVIAEVVTVGAVTQKITPGTIGFNDDGTPSNNAYLKVVNKSGGTNTINVTLHFLQLEA